MILNCMASMGLLKKEDARYDLNNYSRRYFLPSSKDYVGHLLICGDQLLRLWLTLPEAVRTGRPTLATFADEERKSWDIDLIDALFQVHRDSAWRLADILKNRSSFLAGGDARIRVLDVAAGSAVWSIPFTLKYRRVEVTAIDLVPVLEVAKRYTRKFGVEDHYRFVGGDIREIEFGGDQYDLALLGHICHSEGGRWSRRLIGKCSRALKRNGKLLIMDYLPDEERKTDPLPLWLAVNALLGTEEGDTFTFSQYKDWLLSAGFREARTIRVGGRSPIIVALKG